MSPRALLGAIACVLVVVVAHVGWGYIREDKARRATAAWMQELRDAQSIACRPGASGSGTVCDVLYADGGHFKVRCGYEDYLCTPMKGGEK